MDYDEDGEELIDLELEEVSNDIDRLTNYVTLRTQVLFDSIIGACMYGLWLWLFQMALLVLILWRVW